MTAVLATADRQALYGYALHLTRDRTSADDLVQDTLVRALRYQHTYRPERSVNTWLRAILRNVFFDAQHRDRRAASLRSALQTHDVDPPTLAPSSGPDFDPARIAAAIAALPVDFRIAVTLRDLDGLSYTEIAEQTGVSRGTVMSRIRRGRLRLHALLLEHAVELGLVDTDTDTKHPSFRH